MATTLVVEEHNSPTPDPVASSEFLQHPIARDRTPPQTAEEYRALCDDLRAKGLVEPIVLHEGMVLDGWHRLRACSEVGVPPVFRQYAGAGGSPEAFVESRSLVHRQLDPGWLAFYSLNFYGPELERQARTRQGQRSDLPNILRDLGEGSFGRTDDQLAAKVGIKRHWIERARSFRELHPDWVDRVWCRELTLHEAEYEAMKAELMAWDLDAMPAVRTRGDRPRGGRRRADPRRILPPRLVLHFEFQRLADYNNARRLVHRELGPASDPAGTLLRIANHCAHCANWHPHAETRCASDEPT